MLQNMLPFGQGHSHAEANIDDALETSERGIRALKLSLVILGATALLQVVVVLISGSVALLANTIHNFGDALTAVPLWIAFSLARRKPTRRYTYGLARTEDLAGIAILLMIALSAGVALYESVDRVLHPREISFLGWVAAAGVVGFLGNEAVALLRIRVGKQIGSAALIAGGQHARVDGLTSLAVVLGAAGVWLGFPLADPIVGLLITLAIVGIVKGTAVTMFHRLVDAIEPEIGFQIEQLAAAVPGVEAVSAVQARWHGHRIYADLLVVVNEDLPTWESHAIVERVRRDIFHGVPRVGSILVHADPCGHAGVDRHQGTLHHEMAAR